MVEILLTINLRKYLIKQDRSKRLRRAAGYVRERIAHYTKTQPENVKLTQDLNNAIVKRYSKSMSPLKLSIKLEGGKATASQFQEPNAPKLLNPKAKEFQKISRMISPKPKAAKNQNPAQQQTTRKVRT